MAPMPDQVTVVLPTFNRAGALERNLDSLLGLEGVSEILIVDDGSIDRTPTVLAEITDPRVRVIRLEHNSGQPTARNTGALAAAGDWVLFGEDDCRFPPDYVIQLLKRAVQLGADIVSAPFLHLDGVAEDDVAAVASGMPRAQQPAIEQMGNAFPAAPVQTPFLPARALVRRTVFDTVRFDDGYRGNAFREETDFFVCAARAGFKCYLVGDTFNYQIEHWGGGARYPRVSNEYWTLRNNWRFLKRHGDWLREQGNIGSASMAELTLLWKRFAYVVTGTLAARFKSLRRSSDER